MKTPATILFVDDELPILTAIRRTLSGSNLTLLTAQGGAAALETLRSRAVDVLVSDFEMPGMSGLELVRIARQEYPGMLRMILTGAATLDLAVEAINSGEVSRFFSKPFDAILFRETIAALAELIDRHRSTEATQSRNARRRQLEKWVDQRFPNAALGLEHAQDEAMEIDLHRLLRELEPEVPGLSALLGSHARASTR